MSGKGTRKTGHTTRDAEGMPHSHPGSVDQQAEDSFPASDAPSFSPGAIGAPEARETPPLPVQTSPKENAPQPPRKKAEKPRP